MIRIPSGGRIADRMRVTSGWPSLRNIGWIGPYGFAKCGQHDDDDDDGPAPSFAITASSFLPSFVDHVAARLMGASVASMERVKPTLEWLLVSSSGDQFNSEKKLIEFWLDKMY